MIKAIYRSLDRKIKLFKPAIYLLIISNLIKKSNLLYYHSNNEF